MSKKSRRPSPPKRVPLRFEPASANVFTEPRQEIPSPHVSETAPSIPAGYVVFEDGNHLGAVYIGTPAHYEGLILDGGAPFYRTEVPRVTWSDVDAGLFQPCDVGFFYKAHEAPRHWREYAALASHLDAEEGVYRPLNDLERETLREAARRRKEATPPACCGFDDDACECAALAAEVHFDAA